MVSELQAGRRVEVGERWDRVGDERLAVDEQRLRSPPSPRSCTPGLVARRPTVQRRAPRRSPSARSKPSLHRRDLTGRRRRRLVQCRPSHPAVRDRHRHHRAQRVQPGLRSEQHVGVTAVEHQPIGLVDAQYGPVRRRGSRPPRRSTTRPSWSRYGWTRTNPSSTSSSSTSTVHLVPSSSVGVCTNPADVCRRPCRTGAGDRSPRVPRSARRRRVRLGRAVRCAAPRSPPRRSSSWITALSSRLGKAHAKCMLTCCLHEAAPDPQRARRRASSVEGSGRDGGNVAVGVHARRVAAIARAADAPRARRAHTEPGAGGHQRGVGRRGPSRARHR